MASTRRTHRRNKSRQLSFSNATALMIKDVIREGEQHAEIDAYYAPSECHKLVKSFDPDALLRDRGRSLRWWRKEAKRRGLSDKYCYVHGLPYPS